MMQDIFKNAHANVDVIFDMFYREESGRQRFFHLLRPEQVIDYVENLRFNKDDIDYLSSLGIFLTGTSWIIWRISDLQEIYMPYLRAESCSPKEPIVKVKGSIMQAQLLETAILNIINHQSLIATKAARVVHAAEGRSHGIPDCAGPRALMRAYIWSEGCCHSRLHRHIKCAGRRKMFGVPVLGTHAHSWIMSFPDELTAFREYARIYPDQCILLADTYDTLKSGVPNAIKVFTEMREQGIKLKELRHKAGFRRPGLPVKEGKEDV